MLILAPVLHTKCKNAEFLGACPSNPNATEGGLDSDE
jgi:hypothetical protein